MSVFGHFWVTHAMDSNRTEYEGNKKSFPPPHYDEISFSILIFVENDEKVSEKGMV